MQNKYDTHIVIKLDDAKEYLSESEKIRLANILRRIQEGRKADGKPTNNSYYITNMDEPYSNKVYEAICEGEDARGGAV